MRRASSVPVVSVFAALGLAGTLIGMGCSIGGSAAGTGSVAVLVTDAPSGEFERIELLVSKVELLGASRVEIFSGQKTVDLRALASFSNPLFVATDVPVGAYRKVRLTIDDVTLIRELGNGRGEASLETLHLEPPGSGVIDLVPRGSFFVVPGGTLVMEIHVDAAKAIRPVGRGRHDYGIRPVAFVRVVQDRDEDPKPARVRGEIREFLGPLAFTLCSSEIRATRRADTSAKSTPSCLAINLSDATRIFDEPGEPVRSEDLRAGDVVTVVGELRLLRGAAALTTTPGRPTRGSPFALADLDGADIQLDAIAVAVGPKEDDPPDGGAALVDQRTGTLVALDPAARRLEIAMGVDRECISVAPSALLLLLADDGHVASAREISLDDLVDGQAIEVFGARIEGCFTADALVAVAIGGAYP